MLGSFKQSGLCIMSYLENGISNSTVIANTVTKAVVHHSSPLPFPLSPSFPSSPSFHFPSFSPLPFLSFFFLLSLSLFPSRACTKEAQHSFGRSIKIITYSGGAVVVFRWDSTDSILDLLCQAEQRKRRRRRRGNVTGNEEKTQKNMMRNVFVSACSFTRVEELK